MNLIFIGPPGAGKGTYAKELSRRLGIPHISTGDLIRDEIGKQTEIGLKIGKYVNKGELIPDDIMIDMLEKRLKEKDCENGFILDGFPRTLKQAEMLENVVKIDRVINFYAPEDLIVKRLSGRLICPKCHAIYNIYFRPPKKDRICDVCGSRLIQREDDKEDVVKERLRVYEEKSKPVVDFYRKKGILIDIYAEQDVNKVVDEILKKTGG